MPSSVTSSDKTRSKRRFPLTGVLTSLIAVSCLWTSCGGKAKTTNDGAGSNASFESCDSSDECRQGSCICGVCTVECSRDADCAAYADAQCLARSMLSCEGSGKVCIAACEGDCTSGCEGNDCGDPLDPSQPSEPDIIDEPADDDVAEPSEPAPTPTPALPDAAECLQRVMDEGSDVGDPGLDAYLVSLSVVQARVTDLLTRMEELRAEMASTLGTAEDTDALVSAYDAWSTENTTDGLALFMWQPECPVSVSNTVQLTSQCDPMADDRETTLPCSGRCVLPAGSDCRDGTLSCRELATEMCAGVCQGACRVNLASDGLCEGPCDGTCVSTPESDCGDAIVVCESAPSESTPCDGECEGTLTPNTTRSECEAVGSAIPQLNVVCVATRPLPQFEIADDLDEAAVTEFGSTLNDFTRELGALLELNQEASLALRAAATLDEVANDALTLSQSGDISDESGCTERLLADAPSLLGRAGADVNEVLTFGSTFLSNL